MKRLLLAGMWMMGCTGGDGKGSESSTGACLLYGEDSGGGRYRCQVRSAADCVEDGVIEFHEDQTCEALGYTDDCGLNGEYLYEPEWCWA
jgi:hypothetical protein